MTAQVLQLHSGRDPILAAAAVDAFLNRPDLSTGSRRQYRLCLTRALTAIQEDTGPEYLQELDGTRWAAAVEQLWGNRSPSTITTNTAYIRGFLNWCAERSWCLPTDVPVERRKRTEERNRAIPTADLERWWERADLPLRLRVLTVMLYETCARSSEILGLDVPDLDTPNRRARVRRKGGDGDWVYYQTRTARLLPRLLQGRGRGPIFLTDPAPTLAPHPADLCPVTGRARLSYDRLWAEFRKWSDGRWTPHDLRHSALSHRADQGTSSTVLMQMSGHRDIRTLSRYTHVSPDAVMRERDRLDPERRQ